MIKLEVKENKNYFRFSFKTKSSKADINILTISDVHFDNIKCNRKLLKSHLDMIVELNGYITITGDLLCLMQGKYDPRSSKSALMAEHIGGNYIEKVIEDAVDFFAPYAKHILLISKGNHETSVSSRMEFDVLKYFIEKLNAKSGANVKLGEYSGYFQVEIDVNDYRRTVNFGYHHGAWGGVVSKGTQGANRFGLIYPDADVFFTGHTHDGWVLAVPRLRLKAQQEKMIVENQWHVKTGTYKEEFEDGKGWAVERIVMPKFLGGALTNLKLESKKPIKIDIKLVN